MKLIVIILAGIYFLWCAYDPMQWHLIDGVNLVIHEAGGIWSAQNAEVAENEAAWQDI